MLGLKLTTDAHWARLVEENLEEALTDHAYCEQKAASNAISLIVQFPEKEELVRTMAALAAEEMQHFAMVHERILQRGYRLGRERKDEYVHRLRAFMTPGSDRAAYLTDRLLFAAMIEARSCERFRTLAETVDDPELAAFYRDLMASEARHYTTFLKLARLYDDPARVDARWQAFLAYEAEVIREYGKRETIHG